MEFIPEILYTVIAILIAYFIVRRLTDKEDKNFNSKFFKYLIVLFMGAIGFELIIRWTTSKPEIVTQTIEQLQANPEIRRTIGTYEGFGYNKNEIEEIKELPARIAFTLYGSEAEINLSVLIDSSANVFEIKDYKIDSLIKK
ncbi:preprotein translocase subunit YajC [Catalinimonas alkaloidigena]|uniref:hypothetical protein n=1 Tax=Catalinimonas alkaloidigena TaxID=1075417 RepID=UPI0024059685|nr:hypothetical protein [Catalinimonas alkaloidigena]MDF9801421.1 preprotein translocase subunit YajC [Catalinimonas alkaloidigena]